MGTYKGFFSSDDLSGTLGEKQTVIGGASYARPNAKLPREGKGQGSFSDDSVLDAPWDVSGPNAHGPGGRTAIPETDPPFTPIDSKGDLGFGKTDFSVFGKVQKPGRP